MIVEAKETIPLRLAFYNYELDYILGMSVELTLTLQADISEVEPSPLLEFAKTARQFIQGKYYERLLVQQQNAFKYSMNILQVDFLPNLEQFVFHLLHEDLPTLFKFSSCSVVSILAQENKKKLFEFPRG